MQQITQGSILMFALPDLPHRQWPTPLPVQ
jgi:hypothetical protein